MPRNTPTDAASEERWCAEQREAVRNYLAAQKVQHGEIGEWPAWHVEPCLALWAIESLARPGSIGWWAISGDVPTDYISAADVEPPQHPRKAARIFARSWSDLSRMWKAGMEHPDTSINGPREELRPLLEARIRILEKWVNDDSLWPE